MDERIIQFRVGVVVLGTLIATVTLGLLFGELPALVRDTYTIRIRFDDAPGVTKDTPVHKSGILIGRVSEVDFAPDNDGVIVTAEIDADRKIPRTDICRISKSLLGDARVEFISPSALGRPTPTEPAGEASLNGSVARPPLRLVQPVSFQQSGRTGLVGQPALPKPKAGADVYLKDGDVIVGTVVPEAIEVVGNLQQDFAKAVTSVANTSDELRGVVQRVGTLLQSNENRINNIIARTEVITADLQETLAAVNQIVGDEQTRRQLQEAIAQMPDLIRDTRQTVTRMGDTMGLVDQNLTNIAGFTEPLGLKGPEIVARIDQGSEKLDRLLAELLVFSQSLNRGEGTIARLIQDPQLYEQIERTVRNVEELVRKARPIIDDARVFSDKIARHPETLGVRGAIERRPGIK